MNEQALAVAQHLAERFLRDLRGEMIDGRMLIKVAVAGYLAGSGVPTDEAVQAVNAAVVPNLVTHTPPNPLYHGIPWLVSGPVSGAPYYE